MALGCYTLCYMTCLLTVVVGALDISGIDMDASLNPRLVGAVYNLLNKPPDTTKASPIVIDCNNPGVICRFGTSALITTNKECNCKESSGDVPVILGLTTLENKVTNIKEKQGNAAESTNAKVPVYSGVIDTNAVLNEPERPYDIWNFQRNSADKGWRPSVDPTKPRVGELPTRFASYYPFSEPKFPNKFDDIPEFGPGASNKNDVPPHFIFWRKPGSLNNPRSGLVENEENATLTVKITTDKISDSHAQAVTPK